MTTASLKVTTSLSVILRSEATKDLLFPAFRSRSFASLRMTTASLRMTTPFCHPEEQSDEGSALSVQPKQILRFAQDDNSFAQDDNFLSVIPRSKATRDLLRVEKRRE